MKAQLEIIGAFLLSLSPVATFAYNVPTVSYQDLFTKSDFVVIATPKSSRDTSEQMTMKSVNPPVRVIGVTTEFRTLYVLKGSKRSRFKLHHYREPVSKSGVVIGGPYLVTFSPEENKRYLLFLVRESDGRFAPVWGQQDPAGISVQEISGTTWD